MLKSLQIKNFTVFSEASFEFSPGLNVIIGENATGKSHLLKLAYSLMYVWHEAKSEKAEEPGKITSGAGKSWWERRLADKLVNVLKPDTLGNLIHRGKKSAKAEILANSVNTTLTFTFSKASKKAVNVEQPPEHFPVMMPVFIPTKEVLSFYPGFIRLYEERMLAIDETYYDLCKVLSRSLLKPTPLVKPKRLIRRYIGLLAVLETVMGGRVLLEADRFYLQGHRQDLMEISMVAEGLRKLALLTYLLANGSLQRDSLLFWDEPESNLNPKLMKDVACSLVRLADYGVQIILATHNLFLMKELSLLQGKIPAKFFSLVQGDQGVTVEQGTKLTDLPTIVALDEEMALYDREQEAFYAAKVKTP